LRASKRRVWPKTAESFKRRPSRNNQRYKRQSWLVGGCRWSADDVVGRLYGERRLAT
jgi:hypothetical protein